MNMDDFKKLRLEANMTQVALANKANISLRHLVRIEHNECRPNLETKILLYKALGIDPDSILEYILENYILND